MLSYNYPNGFIDDKCILPAEFCSLGVRKYVHLIKSDYKYCLDEIKNSLDAKLRQIGDERLVNPCF